MSKLKKQRLFTCIACGTEEVTYNSNRKYCIMHTGTCQHNKGYSGWYKDLDLTPSFRVKNTSI